MVKALSEHAECVQIGFEQRLLLLALVDIHLIEGVFDKSQKQAMIDKVTNAMVEVEGEAMRGVTWVRVYEVASGEWAIGGKALSAADVKAMRARPQ